MEIKQSLVYFSALVLFQILVSGCGTEDQMSKDTVSDIFGQNISIKLDRSKDLGGVDVHGDIFQYFEYEIEPSELSQILKSDDLQNYPSFNSGYFHNAILTDTSFAVKWRHFPLNHGIDTSIFAATFRTSPAISAMNHEKPYLDKENLYACILAKGAGNCFFILVPKKNKLYWILRRG